MKRGFTERVVITMFSIRLDANKTMVSEPLGFYGTLEKANEIAEKEFTRKGYKVKVTPEKVIADVNII